MRSWLIVLGMGFLLSVNVVCALKSPVVVNLNSADLKQLITLKGIGEKRAQRILAYRHLHGPFNRITDIENVPGITTKLLKKIQEKNVNRLSLEGK